MRLVVPALFTLAILLCAADDKRKPGRGPKPPEVELVEIACYRTEGRIVLDGRVRNSSGRPLKRLKLVFRFMAPGRQVITTREGPVEEALLEPDAESEFHLKMTEPARVVEYDVNCVEGGGRDLRIDRSGPFPVE